MKEGMMLKMVNGQLMKSEGAIMLVLDSDIPHTFQILDNLQTEGIIGMDLLKKGVVDGINNTVKIMNKSFQLEGEDVKVLHKPFSKFESDWVVTLSSVWPRSCDQQTPDTEEPVMKREMMIQVQQDSKEHMLSPAYGMVMIEDHLCSVIFDTGASISIIVTGGNASLLEAGLESESWRKG